jgi:CheY-like chemotaxis protein
VSSRRSQVSRRLISGFHYALNPQGLLVLGQAETVGGTFFACVAAGMTKQRVLIVEDNEDAGEMYRILIELYGHEALVAENGVRGLEMLKSARPDIALVDIGLPGMDGYEIARRFRAEPDGDRVYLVALTGYGSSADRDRSRRAGFDLHLLKPIDPQALKSLLDHRV